MQNRSFSVEKSHFSDILYVIFVYEFHRVQFTDFLLQRNLPSDGPFNESAPATDNN